VRVRVSRNLGAAFEDREGFASQDYKDGTDSPQGRVTPRASLMPIRVHRKRNLVHEDHRACPGSQMPLCAQSFDCFTRTANVVDRHDETPRPRSASRLSSRRTHRRQVPPACREQTLGTPI